MMLKIYKTRRDAEQHREKGDLIYFVNTEGYYLLPNNKLKLSREYDRGWWHGSISSTVIIFVSFMIGYLF